MTSLLTIPEWIGLALLAVIGTIIWWGFQRMVQGQDAITKQLAAGQHALAQQVSTLSLSVVKICGNVEKAVVVQEQHKDICDERHDLNVEEHKNVWGVIEKIRTPPGPS